MSFAIAILATYRIAHLLPEDDGPFFIFTRIRNFAKEKATISYCVENSVQDESIELVFEPYEVTEEMLLSDSNQDLGKWINLYKGINCVYCCGLYAAILCGLLAIWNNYYGNIFLFIFALAGAQSFLQKVSSR